MGPLMQRQINGPLPVPEKRPSKERDSEVNKMAGNKPVKKISAGQGVSVALWQNEIDVGGQKRTVLKASIERRYKDRDGNWQSSTSFGRNEIPMAIYCLWKAFEAMVASDQEEIEEVAV
jgi:hypothetical protein